MKGLFLIALLLAVSACTTNGVYDSKKTWSLVGGALIGGYFLTKDADNNKKENCHWMILPDNDMIWVCS